MKITINVTKKHLDTAMAAAAKSTSWVIETCLVAQAVKDVFPRKVVKVSYFDFTLGKNNDRLFILPKSATRLIKRFDNVAGEKFEDLTKEKKAYLTKLRQSLPVSFTVVEG